MTAKKKAKNAVAKKKPAPKTAARKPVVKKVIVKSSTKAVKKQLKSISKKLDKSKQQSSRSDRRLKVAVSRNAKTSQRIKVELEKLREDLKKAKGKRSKKQLSEYNLFMRRQLLQGRTFSQAIRIWQKLRRVEEGRIPTRTRVKTVVQRIRSKPRVVVRTRTRRVLVPSKPRVVVRTRRVLVKGKPQIRTVTKTRTIVKKSRPVIRTVTKFVEKPVIRTVEKPILDAAMMERLAELVAKETAQKVSRSAEAEVTRTRVSRRESESSLSFTAHDLATEEMAYRMVKMYFEELARIGFKRQMSLDDLVDAFIYSWYRVEKRLGRKQDQVHREEMAYRLVNLYFIELARIGHKRTLNLDELLDAYFYVVDRLGKDNTELIKQMDAARLAQSSSSTTTTVTTTTQTQPAATMPSQNP